MRPRVAENHIIQIIIIIIIIIIIVVVVFVSLVTGVFSQILLSNYR